MRKKGGSDHFTIGEKYSELFDALDAKSRTRDKSDWICRTLLAKWHEEKRGAKMTDYVDDKGESKPMGLLQEYMLIFNKMNELTPHEARRMYSSRELAQIRSIGIMIKLFAEKAIEEGDHHMTRNSIGDPDKVPHR